MAGQIIVGDALEALRTLPDGCADTCVTSPPYYGLRDYGTAQWEGGEPACDHVVGEIRTGCNLSESACSTRGGAIKAKNIPNLQAKGVCPKCGAVRVDKQIGLEATPETYIERLAAVFREVRRVIRDDGTLWLNLADSYADKSLLGISWRVALALQADGWILRQDIIWHKPNPMPESVRDRCTKAHEYLFLLAKSPCYYFDGDAIKEDATSHEINRRNKRSVWTVATAGCKDAHFATFPEALVIPCIKAGSREGGVVLDPFLGSGTTGRAAKRCGRSYIGVELNPAYADMARRRIEIEIDIFSGGGERRGP